MPFHNIFSKITQRSRKSKGKIKPKIIADIHEKDSLILAELTANKEVELLIKPLKIGDYIIGNTIIERKTTRDFISSMINKRLIQQLKQMQKYKQQLLIIEGDLEGFNDFQTPNAIRGFILSIITNYQIPIIFAQDYQDTSKYLITLAKQQLKKPIKTSFHSRIPKTLKEQKQYVLEAFPNIGPATAKKLLKKFKSIKNTINASEEELKEILKNKAENFKKILDS
jgi:Fanconi anemia group M protein